MLPSSSLISSLLPLGVSSVTTLVSSLKRSFIPLRVTIPFSWLSSDGSMGGGLALLWSTPRITGLRGSLSRKPRITSSPISGRKKKPRLSPASGIAMRAQTPSSSLLIFGMRTFTRNSPSGSPSSAVTRPICNPSIGGSNPPAAASATSSVRCVCQSGGMPSSMSVSQLRLSIS